MASSHLGNIPLLMATEADDRHLAAGKLAKAISRPLASCSGRPRGGVGPEGEHGQHSRPHDDDGHDRDTGREGHVRQPVEGVAPPAEQLAERTDEEQQDEEQQDGGPNPSR